MEVRGKGWRRWAARVGLALCVLCVPGVAGAVTIAGTDPTCAALAGYPSAAQSLSIQGVNGELRMTQERCRVERVVLSERVERRTVQVTKYENAWQTVCDGADGSVLLGCRSVPTTRAYASDELQSVTIQDSEWTLHFSAYVSGSGGGARAFPPTLVELDVKVRGEQPSTPTDVIANAAYRRLYDLLLPLARPSPSSLAAEELLRLRTRCHSESDAAACEDVEVLSALERYPAPPSIPLLERACARSGRGCLALARHTPDPTRAAALRAEACTRDAAQCLPAAEMAPGGDGGAEGLALLERGCTAREHLACKRLGTLRRPGLYAEGWRKLGHSSVLVKVPDGLVEANEQVPPAFLGQALALSISQYRLEGTSIVLRYVATKHGGDEWVENSYSHDSKGHTHAWHDFQIVKAKVRKEGCKTDAVEVCRGRVTGTRFGVKGRWRVITAEVPNRGHGVAILIEGTPEDLKANAALLEQLEAAFLVDLTA